MYIPGQGRGWSRVAGALAQRMDPARMDRIWLFPPMTRDGREWATAVIAGREQSGKLKVFTARYMLILRGRERGSGRVEVEEVGIGPEEVIQDVLRGVQERTGETEPPVEISPEVWYGDGDDESATES